MNIVMMITNLQIPDGEEALISHSKPFSEASESFSIKQGRPILLALLLWECSQP